MLNAPLLTAAIDAFKISDLERAWSVLGLEL